jgi:hypothetical protein
METGYIVYSNQKMLNKPCASDFLSKITRAGLSYYKFIGAPTPSRVVKKGFRREHFESFDETRRR